MNIVSASLKNSFAQLVVVFCVSGCKPLILSNFYVALQRMLYLIGLGLGELEDISVRGLKVAKSAARVYFEIYTSLLRGTDGGKAELEEFLGRPVISADREWLEERADEILEGADKEDVAVLVVGDPMAATTHSDLVLRARSKNPPVPVKILHNASIISAVGCTGLQVYRFGAVVSIVFWSEAWRPTSFVDNIADNLKRGLHTLCLLDIKVREPTIKSIMRGGKREYEPARFMSVSVAASQLLEAIIERDEVLAQIGAGGDFRFSRLSPKSICIGIARVGNDDEKLVAGRLCDLPDVDMGGPLHSLIICGDLHPMEKDFIKQFALPSLKAKFDQR